MTEKERVAEHLSTLSILHYVYSAMHLLGMCGGVVYMLMGGFFAQAIKSAPNAPHGAEWFGGFFVIIGAFVMLVAATGAVCLFLSARWLKQHRNRAFSQVVAGISCINIPLGTALGVATFVVLGKPEAAELYREAETGATPAA